MELLKKTKKNEMIIIYQINGEDNEESEDNQDEDEDKYEIKLFGEIFIKKNKNNCRIIIDNKE